MKVKALEGDTVDSLCFRYYGTTQGVTEKVLDANPGLCQQVFLDAGQEVEMPEPEKKKLRLHDDDIMGLDPVELEVSRWKWARHVAYSSGKEMLKVTYYGGLCDSKAITEYLPLLHGGYAGEKATGMIP